MEQDFQKAVEWYLKAANQGMAVSQETLGWFYAHGRGVEQDDSQAAHWYREAAEQGRANAQYNLGQLYFDGRGVAKDYQEALKWYRKAADQNFAQAQNKIGSMYQSGIGVERDYVKAADWRLKAANQGHLEAQESLGELYSLGLGVRKDDSEAIKWYKKAAEGGSKTARAQYEKLERQAFNEATRKKVAQMDRDGILPAPATIFGDRVSLRYYPSINAGATKQLNAGHPISIARRDTESDGDWYFVQTASGTEGWVRGEYVALKEDSQDEYENNKRKRSLPSRAMVIRGLNVRNIPSAQSSKVLEQLEAGTYITVTDIYAGPNGDWFHIRTDYYTEGWVFGKYVEFRS